MSVVNKHFFSFANKHAGGTAIVVGKGPTTFDYAELKKHDGPIVFINDAAQLAKFCRDEQEKFQFYLDDNQARHWLTGAALPGVTMVVKDVHRPLAKRPDLDVIWYRAVTAFPVMSREDLSKSPTLFIKKGTITPVLHWLWYLGVRTVKFVGCDGLNDKTAVHQLTGGKDYDQRLNILTTGRSGWVYNAIRKIQDDLVGIFGFEAIYLGTPVAPKPPEVPAVVPPAPAILVEKTPCLVLVRKQMRGDVLLCSAVVKAVSEKYPEAKIYFRTDYPDIFRNNPRVVYAGRVCSGLDPAKTKVINLDLVLFEKMPGWHLIDGFSAAAGFKRGEIKKVLEMYPSDADKAWATAQLAAAGLIEKQFAVLAPGPGLWAGRNWPENRWLGIIRSLRLLGVPSVVVGADRKFSSLSAEATVDLRGRTTFGQLAAITAAAGWFVGLDSFPAHVAGAVRTPRVVLFGVTLPECTLCESVLTIPVVSDRNHPMTGARNRVNSMRQIEVGAGANNPMNLISERSVLQAFERLKEQTEQALEARAVLA